MIILLFSVLATVSAQEQHEKLKFMFFEKLDRNKDGLLTHDQFIEGLHRAFMTLVITKKGIENSKTQVNNFGREFLGEKDSDGAVDLNDIIKWIESHELENAFEEWLHINNEGERHHKVNHQHQGRPPRIPRRSAFRRRAQGDL